jgi:hypothetical protein
MPDTTPADIADFLSYMAACDRTWKANVLSFPLLSKCKADFGPWVAGGKPAGPQNGKNAKSVSSASGATKEDTPPEGYSYDKDERGRWIDLAGDDNGVLPYGARTEGEALERHREEQRRRDSVRMNGVA